MSWRAVLAAVLRESRASRGRLLFFTGCLAIGVAAVVGVSSLVAAMEASLRSSSRDLLAADLRVSARRELPEELAAFFESRPHERTDVRQLAAMASLGEGTEDEPADSRLVELKVIDGVYPFYGQLVLTPADLGVADLKADTVFAAPELLLGLGIDIGDELHLGGAAFRVAGEVVDEPDRLDFAMTLGPRIFMSAEGLARTNLFVAKSRVSHRALYRLPGDPTHDELERLEDELRAALANPSYVRISTHTEAQPNVRRALGRVEDYLGLVALLSLLLGGIGVSQIVRAWLAGRAGSVAVMRCLGLRAREIAALYLGHVALLAVLGCVLGGVLGALLPWAVQAWAPDLFQGGAEHLWQPGSLLRGLALGLLVALLFSLPPLTAVWRVPPAAVLRAEAVPLAAPAAVRFGAPTALLVGVFVSAFVQADDLLVAASFTGGLLVLAALLYGGARATTSLSGSLPRGAFGPYVEHGLAALARPGAGTVGAIVALGLGVMVVVSMLLIEQRLEEALRTALPEAAPSVFLVDVQPDQWDGVRTSLEDRGARSIDGVPVVMARLRAIEGRDVQDIASEYRSDRRSTWRFTREQRLTWMDELPADNEIVEGALWSDPERDEVSLEEDFAESLGVEVGDLLTFDVQGISVDLTVTSVRTVDWQSFGINFFLVVEPGVLDGAPHFRLAAARLDPEEAEYELQNELAASFPNVTMLRVRPILEKVADVLTRIAFGVRALGSFTILTGLVILAGAVGTTALRRAREAALLKALGITRGGVTRLFAVEYALSGLVAGAIGSSGALVLAWAFLKHLAELEPELPLRTVPVAAVVSSVLATLSGLSASLRALRARPLETLRG
ncbi:MAG: FtsX-like permease family protein [Planctomycetota bacterium]